MEIFSSIVNTGIALDLKMQICSNLFPFDTFRNILQITRISYLLRHNFVWKKKKKHWMNQNCAWVNWISTPASSLGSLSVFWAVGFRKLGFCFCEISGAPLAAHSRSRSLPMPASTLGCRSSVWLDPCYFALFQCCALASFLFFSHAVLCRIVISRAACAALLNHYWYCSCAVRN